MLWKNAGGASELDYTEQTSWLLFLLIVFVNSLADAVADLGGRPEEINIAFAGFQQYLYHQTVAVWV